MTIDLPSPRGFLYAPNGAKSSIRLILIVAVLVGVFFLLSASIVLVWIAVYHQDALAPLGTIYAGLGGGWAFLTGKLAKWKAVQSQWEKPADDEQPDGDPAPVASGLVDDSASLTLVSALTPPIPQEAVDLILEQEGIDQPALVPPGDSGVSIGYGYDLGWEQHFVRDWSGVIPDAWIKALSAAIGLRGRAARGVAARFRAIRITSGQAHRVFCARTLPQEMASMQAAMPGIDMAPPLIQGAVLSCGYNRGWGMKDEPGQKSRSGMRKIRDAVASRRWNDIPGYLREMAGLWPVGNGVHSRRLAEAKLAEGALAQLA